MSRSSCFCARNLQAVRKLVEPPRGDASSHAPPPGAGGGGADAAALAAGVVEAEAGLLGAAAGGASLGAAELVEPPRGDAPSHAPPPTAGGGGAAAAALAAGVAQAEAGLQCAAAGQQLEDFPPVVYPTFGLPPSPPSQCSAQHAAYRSPAYHGALTPRQLWDN